MGATVVGAVRLGRDPTTPSVAERLANVVPVPAEASGDVVRGAFAAASLVATVAVAVRIASNVEVVVSEPGSMPLLRSASDYWSFVATSATAAAFATGVDGMRERLGDGPRHPLLSALAAVTPFVSFFFLRSWTGRVLESLDVPHDEAIRTRTLVDLSTAASAVSAAISVATIAANWGRYGEALASTNVVELVDSRMHAAIAIGSQVLIAMAMRRLAAVPFDARRESPELEGVFA